MIILIAHRGNFQGKNLNRENQEEYILEAAQQGFDVEIDVWWFQGSFWLGHDEPQYKTTLNFLENPKFWCHLKNIEAVQQLMNIESLHWFWHETDKITITNKGYIWTYPGVFLENSIINQPPNVAKLKSTGMKILGICADDFTGII